MGVDLGAPIDPVTGEKVKVNTWAYESGRSMIPKRFKAIVTVRGPEQEKIIRREWLDAEKTFAELDIQDVFSLWSI